jgi:hypothetical protein
MPQRALLSEFWRDIVSISSAVITTVGFIITIVQIRKTRSSAEAARKAASEAVSESRKSFERYALSNAFRYLAETKLHVGNRHWSPASLRLNDLAEQTGQLAALDPGEWKELTIELRRWSDTIARLPDANPKFAHLKWAEFVRRLQEKIDERHGPFSTSDRG